MIITKATRLFPFWKGRGVLANSSFMRNDENSVFTARLNEGQEIFATRNDYISRMIMFFGDLDPSITRLIKSLVSEGDAVIDIGANLGVLSLAISKWVGVSGLVVAFEPQMEVVDLLRQSIMKNCFDNIEVFPLALSNFDGEGLIRSHESSLGTGRLTDSNNIENLEACSVRKLDSISVGLGGRHLKLIKMDVEGEEAKVLEGASCFLDEHQPEYIILESHPGEGTLFDRPEISFLRRKGYQIYAIEKSLLIRPVLKKLGGKPGEVIRTSEFLAVKGSKKSLG